jgi:glycosyltransferase involved in cell wall biosynthesis
VTLLFPSNPIKNLFFEEKYDLDPSIKVITSHSYLPVMLLNHMIYPRLVKRHLDRFDSFISIGGQNFESAPFILAKKEYIPWVGTTFEDEWKYVSNSNTGISPRILGRINNITRCPLKRIEKRIYNKAWKICAVSNYTRKRIIEDLSVKGEKVKVVQNPVDTRFFTPTGERLNRDRFILFVGRLDQRKNLAMLLKSFQMVKKDIEDVDLLIIGEGPEEGKMRGLSKKLGIEKSVEFLGFVNYKDLPMYYRSSEFFVLSSLQEGFGIVLIEAMACGKPVISTDCGGPSDFVVNGKNGFLVPVNDINLMASKMLELLKGDRLIKKMGRNALKTAKRFDIENVGKKLLFEMTHE